MTFADFMALLACKWSWTLWKCGNYLFINEVNVAAGPSKVWNNFNLIDSATNVKFTIGWAYRFYVEILFLLRFWVKLLTRNKHKISMSKFNFLHFPPSMQHQPLSFIFFSITSRLCFFIDSSIYFVSQRPSIFFLKDCLIKAEMLSKDPMHKNATSTNIEKTRNMAWRERTYDENINCYWS